MGQSHMLNIANKISDYRMFVSEHYILQFTKQQNDGLTISESSGHVMSGSVVMVIQLLPRRGLYTGASRPARPVIH